MRAERDTMTGVQAGYGAGGKRIYILRSMLLVGTWEQGRNAIRFARDMEILKNVTVPQPFLTYTSRKVSRLTTTNSLPWRGPGKLSVTSFGPSLILLQLCMPGTMPLFLSFADSSSSSSVQVLTTEWVEGEKLSESRAGDLGSLVTTALNCYLVQLLETGFLHADPHPGNLLRTPDGRLCVLDFGLMTEVGT